MRFTGSTQAANGWNNQLAHAPAVAVVKKPVRGAAPSAKKVALARAPRRASRALGWVVGLGVGAAVAALAVANLYDSRSLGTQLDDTVASVRDFGNQAGQTLKASQDAAAEASRTALDGVTTAIDDTGISAKVKTALAADPTLKASRIIVNTDRGVVRLEGPAPDAVARDRATILAGAPRGVRGVDNRLTLPQPGNVVAVTDGTVRAAPAVQPTAAPANAAVLLPVAATGQTAQATQVATQVAADAPAYDDAAVTSQVKAALASDATLGLAKIDVTTNVGVVRMEGVVPDATARDRAVLLASSQRGVRAVDNRLALPEPSQVAMARRGPTEQAAQ